MTRTGLAQGDERVTIVQRSTLAANGPGPLPEGVSDGTVAYPATFVSRSAFESALESGYDIVARIREDRVSYDVAGHQIDTYGYACRLRRTS